MRSSTWAWPIVQSTTWSVSLECSMRIVTSSATRRCRAPPSLSSSDFVAARIATGSCGSGSSHGATTAGRSCDDRVSEVSARVSLETSARSPAIAVPRGRWPSTKGAASGPTRSSSSCAGVAGDLVPDEVAEVPGDVDGLVDAKRAREDPHEREASDVGVGRRAHDLGDERLGRVARHPFEGPAHGRRDVGKRVHRRVGEGTLDDAEQLLDAGAGQRGDGQDREEGALRDGGAQVAEERVGVERLALEVAVEQRRVLRLLDDRLDEGAAGVLVLAGRSRR